MLREMAFLLGTSFMLQTILMILVTIGIIVCINSVFYEAVVNSNSNRGNSQQFKEIQTSIICKLIGVTAIYCAVFISGTVVCFSFCFN